MVNLITIKTLHYKIKTNTVGQSQVKKESVMFCIPLLCLHFCATLSPVNTQ